MWSVWWVWRVCVGVWEYPAFMRFAPSLSRYGCYVRTMLSRYGPIKAFDHLMEKHLASMGKYK